MTKKIESIILGGGCFWCTEAIYLELKGVITVTSGYAGGYTKNPSYDLVCEGDTGHAEVIKVDFDPEIINLNTLLDIFWDIHDPTSINKQGNDVGTQYRSVIYFYNEAQLLIIRESIVKLKLSNIYSKPIVTEIKPFTNFYPAEDCHKDYYSKNSSLPYCNLVISPKMKHFREKYYNLLKPET